MKNIQVDMFEVQLGAALLLQFRLTNGQVVRVLADAGVDKSSGYKVEHVYNKLFRSDGEPTDVWTDFSDSKPKLDLIIGTHYDADHLRGLAPIIENTSLDIGEIWLPPVQDDAGKVSTGSVAGGDASLVKRLMADGGNEVLHRYLSKRVERINDVDRVYGIDANALGNNPRESDARHDGSPERMKQFQEERFDAHNIVASQPSATPDFFEGHLDRACSLLGEDGGHAHEYEFEDDRTFVEAVDALKDRAVHHWMTGDLFGLSNYDDSVMRPSARGWLSSATLHSDQLALENIRKSAANEAINATSLAEVVAAVKRRHATGGSRIRIRSEGIPQGSPRYFHWNGQRFQEANAQAPAELGFHVLGPSHELVAQLHEQLPIGTYLLAYRTEGLASGTVTPSNRLSYVVRFHLQEQNILVSGDAGFSDFAPTRSTQYFPALLALLKPLHVVQVAHHGGLNHRFYQALDSADMPGQTDWSFLLLSHAVNDKTRPRAEFSRFVAQFRQDARNDVSALFTSHPMPDKVDTIDDLIHPVVPAGNASADRGDVRLSFPHQGDAARGGTRWQVSKHAIQV